jgi:gamma-tubulin complex component 5
MRCDLELANNPQELTDDGADELGAYYKLRSRLLWFNTTLYSYLTDLVIQMNTLQMHEALTKGEDIDQMIEVHRTYMKRMIDQALLGMRLELIHKSIITILDLSIQLSDARSRQNFARGAKDATTDMVQGLSLNRPKRQFTASGQQRPSHRKESDSSDGEDSDQENKPQSTHVAETRLSYAGELRNMLSQFDRLCRFVATGLRGVARAGGEPNWDMLADKLESGMGFGV